jgi:hypothetical protein
MPAELVASQVGGLDVIDIAGLCFLLDIIIGYPLPSKMIVRHEYVEAYQMLETATAAAAGGNGSGGVVVAGQPGIGTPLRLLPCISNRNYEKGKSCLLVYAMFRRLLAGGTVAVQNADEYYLFTKREVSVHKLHDVAALNAANPATAGVWCFSDSNARVMQLCNAFLISRAAFTIQTTTPRTHRWKWKKERSATMYIMDIWNMEEMLVFA